MGQPLAPAAGCPGGESCPPQALPPTPSVPTSLPAQSHSLAPWLMRMSKPVSSVGLLQWPGITRAHHAHKISIWPLIWSPRERCRHQSSHDNDWTFEGKAVCQAEKQEGREGSQVRLCPADLGHLGRVLGPSVSLPQPLRGLLWDASPRWCGRNLLWCGFRTDDLLRARGPGGGAASLTPPGESTLPLGSIIWSLVSWVIVNRLPRDRALRAERVGLQGGGLSPCADPPPGC